LISKNNSSQDEIKKTTLKLEEDVTGVGNASGMEENKS
jgi:hypothetical protein